MTYIILASFVVMLASLAGVLFVSKHLSIFIEKNLSVLVSFSAGVFLFVTYRVGIETVEHADTLLYALFWILAGILFILAIFRSLPNFHHHHDEREEEHTHSSIDARRILIGDGAHNIGDGILIAATFAISVPLGIATTASIFVHELVHEVSEFFVLRQAGYSTKKALFVNFLVSGTILIGALGGYFLFDIFEMIEAPLLGITTGALLVVVFYDLIPHSVRSSQHSTQYARHIIWFVLGGLLMFLVGTLFGSH